MRSNIAKECQCVIKREAGGELPLWNASARVDGPEKLERTNEVRRQSQQTSAFGARLEDEMEKAVLEIAQAAVNEPGRTARCAARKIVFLHERDAQSAQCGVASDAAAGNSAADDQNIELVACERGELRSAFLDRRLGARGGGDCQIVNSGVPASLSVTKLIRTIRPMTSSGFDDSDPIDDVPDFIWVLVRIWMYVRGPYVLYHSSPIMTNNAYSPVSSEDERTLPPALREYRDAAERELTAVGFAAPVRGTSRHFASIHSWFTLLEHPTDGALGLVSIIRGKKLDTLRGTVIFQSRFANGAVLATSNSVSVPRTPPRPSFDSIRFPWIHDGAELYAVHRFRVAEYRRTATQLPMTRGADPFAYQTQEGARTFEHFIRCGYYRRMGDSMLRHTVGGAMLSAWRGMFPWREISERMMMRKAAGVLARRRRASADAP